MMATDLNFLAIYCKYKIYSKKINDTGTYATYLVQKTVQRRQKNRTEHPKDRILKVNLHLELFQQR